MITIWTIPCIYRTASTIGSLGHTFTVRSLMLCKSSIHGVICSLKEFWHVFGKSFQMVWIDATQSSWLRDINQVVAWIRYIRSLTFWYKVRGKWGYLNKPWLYGGHLLTKILLNLLKTIIKLSNVILSSDRQRSTV